MTAGISLDWRDDVPIWKQIKDRLQAAILDGTFKEGEAIPSVRQLALELRVNPLTVSRAFSELGDEGLLDKRRGLGMFVTTGAREKARDAKREELLTTRVVELVAQAKALGISCEQLQRIIGRTYR